MRLGRRGRRAAAPFSKRALLQHVNRELAALAGDATRLQIYCECGRDDCILSLEVAADQLAAARTHPDGLIVAPEHRRGSEPMLQRHEAFVVLLEGEVPDAAAFGVR